jgi:ankyrin repeat protein
MRSWLIRPLLSRLLSLSLLLLLAPLLARTRRLPDVRKPLLSRLLSLSLLLLLAPLLARTRRLPDVRKLNRELLRAARAGDAGAATRALRLGAQVNGARLVVEGNRQSETALHLASNFGHLETVQVLLVAGADLAIPGDDGHTALMDASFEGHLNVVRALVAAGAQITETCVYGETPLHEAAQGGQDAVLDYLIGMGHEVDPRDTRDLGATPLMLAARGGHLSTIRKLIEAGADPGIRTDDGKTAASHYVGLEWPGKELTLELERAMLEALSSSV